MKFAHSQTMVLITALLVSACAVTRREPLPPSVRDEISSTEVVVPVRQSEIYVYVPPSQVAAAGGGGLLLALVDVAVNDIRTSKAEDAVKPLRDALADYQFDETLREGLKAALSGVPWLRVQDVRLMKEDTPDSLDGALAQSKAGAVLFTDTDYRLSNSGDILSITVKTDLFGNTPDLKMLKPPRSGPKTAVQNALYRNDALTFETKRPGATDDRMQNIANWSADNGAAARSALTMGAAKLAALLATDLEQSQDGPGEAASQMNGETVKVDGISGQVVSTDTDGEIVRFKDGTMTYVTKSVLTP